MAEASIAKGRIGRFIDTPVTSVKVVEIPV
jgi:hypothetical protein